MKPLLAITVGLTATLLATAPVATSAQALARGPVVKDVRIVGTRRVEADVVRAAISEKKGAPYDPRTVARDVRALMKLGYFSDVEVDREGDPNEPVLVYNLTERPTVAEVKHEGNEELSNDDLKDTIELKPFDLLDLAKVQKDVKKIQDKYVEKGYFLAEVTYRLEKKPDNQVNVVYVINEKAKVLVREVRFVGNEHVSADEILQYMQTRPGDYLSFVTGTGTFKEDAFDHDLQAVSAVYLDRGYVTVKVGKPTLSLSPDKRYIYITIPVEEGEQYTIGSVKFSGQLLGQEPALWKVVKSKEGELFVRSRVGQDLFALGDVYRDLGYAYANVTPLTAADPVKRLIDLNYEVQPGQQVHFERIEFVGNERTRDKVIRRELRIYEGELFNGSALKTSKNRVTALGYFETVEITTKPGSADDKIVAIVEVKEKSTGTFQLGAGFSSYENFVLTGQIAQQNFFGWGQSLSLQVQWSSIRQLGQIQFVEPYFLDTKWTFAFDVYANEGIYTSFTRRAVGGNVTWGYELSGLAPYFSFARNLEDVRLLATYTDEHVNVNNAATGVVSNSLSSGTTSSLRLTLQVDKRDNRIFPTAGLYGSVSLEAAPPFLSPEAIFGQTYQFTRASLDLRAYHPFPKGFVGRLRLTAGAIRAWDSSHPVPISELYYVGGINSVRGYRYLSISPIRRIMSSFDPLATTTTVAIGGDWDLVINSEIEFPVVEKVGLKGVVFFDAGNSYSYRKDPFELSGYDRPLYMSLGFGFRWQSPVGPLRFEWGFPLNRRRDPITGTWIDQPVDFEFTIGNFF